MSAHPETIKPAIADRIHERRWMILAVLCLSLVLIVAGNSSLNVALPFIQAALGSTPSQLQWMVDAYSLTFAVLLLPAGALADRFGRKTSLQVGLVVFGLASLAATLSTQNWELIAMRSLTGAGAAFIMPGTLSILTNVFHDPRERQRAIAIWAGFAGLGGAIGPIVSGLLLEHFSWSSVFFISVVIVIIALVAGAFLLPNSSDPDEARLDPIGVLLAVGAVGPLLYGIIEAPEHGWASPTTLTTVAVGLIVLVGFVTWELRNPHPMLDIRLFRVRAFSVGSSTITLQFFAMYGLYFAMAQYLQISHGYSALQAGLAGLPIGVFGMLGAPMSAKFVRRFGHGKVVGVGLLLSAGGLAIMSGVTPTTTFALLFVGFCLMGFGNGQTTAPSTTLIMSSVPRTKSGVGSAVNDLSRELGGALGIAVLGSVMASVYRSKFTGHVGSPELAARVGSTVDSAHAAMAHLSPADAATVHHAVQASFADGFGVAMLVGAAILVANAALVWVRGTSLDPGAGGHAG
ncbi:MAG: MFS transporter [Actinobacteria bacterium]|nr:MFS transporter [Actinomycetota bacterium]